MVSRTKRPPKQSTPNSDLEQRIINEIKRGTVSTKLAQLNLYEFVQQAWSVIEPSTPFVGGLHLQAICEHLEAVARGDIQRLLINMPPRFCKSTIVGVMWFAWMWASKPYLRFLCSSYALSLAIRDNRKSRLLIQSPWYQSRYGSAFQFSGDQNVKSRFENDKRGYRLSVSVGSAATGEGGDILLIDDPHNIEEKESQSVRESVLDWFDTTWSTRLNSQQTGAMVVVGQRIHEQDLSGHILEQGGWEHLNLPAEYDASSKCVTRIWQDWRTEEGQLLWPDRFPSSVLEEQKRKLGTLGYAALYQQRPVPAGGGTFKKQWLHYFTQNDGHYALEMPDSVKRIPADQCQRFITVDLAISEKQSADYTVFSVWVMTPDRELLLLDRLRDHLDNPEQQKQIQLLYQHYHPIYIMIENVAYQLALIQQLLRLGLPIREYKPVKDKVSRASTASVFYEAGRVYHPKHAHWLTEWEDELLMFPMAAHDDQVDTVSMACDAIGAQASSDEHIEAMKRRVLLQQQRAAMGGARG